MGSLCWLVQLADADLLHCEADGERIVVGRLDVAVQALIARNLYFAC